MGLRDDPEKMRKYKREWIAKRRAEFFADKSCVKCGSTRKMQLDHINPADKTHHAIWSWSKERREAEIAKCQVLCELCHLAKTMNDAGLSFNLHNLAGYRRGCRCDVCKAAKSVVMRRYRENRKKRLKEA